MPVNGLELSFFVRPTLGRLRRSAFLKNVLIVMSGTALAQAIGFAISPLISRLFSPVEFGIAGAFNAVLMVCTAGVTLEYGQAIMLPKQPADAINLFMVSCLCTSIVGSLLILLSVLAPGFLIQLVKSPNAWLPGLLVLGVVSSGLNQTLQAWCVRAKAFRRAAAAQVVRSASANGLQVGLGAVGAGAPGLVFSAVVADVLAGLSLLRGAISELKAGRQLMCWKRMLTLAKDYRDFPLYGGSQNILNALSRGLPVLLLTHFYGLAVAGAFAFGNRILAAPMELILTSLRQVLYQRASEVQSDGCALYRLYRKTVIALLALAVAPTLALVVWSPQIFTVVFGHQWIEAGNYARYLVIWLIASFCSAPVAAFARLVRAQHWLFALNLLMLVGRTTVLFLGGLYLSPMQSIIAFSVVGLIVNAGMILVMAILVRRKCRR